MFRIFVIAAIGFVAAAVASYAAVLFGTLAIWRALGVTDHDGGGTMALGLVIAPLCALAGGAIGAIAGVVFAGKLPKAASSGPDDIRRFLILGGVIAGGVAGYLISKFGFWLASPIRYDSLWKVHAHAWLPTIALITGALAGGIFASTRGRK